MFTCRVNCIQRRLRLLASQSVLSESSVVPLNCRAGSILALGPVSRILFCALRRFSRHFSHAPLAVHVAERTHSREGDRLQHTRGYWTGRPATYFALHRKGFFVPARSRETRWALTPPFHPCPARFEGEGRGIEGFLPRPSPSAPDPSSGGMFSVTLSVDTP